MATLEENYDVIVVGAGVQGLCAAHTFLSIDPSLSLLVVDSKASVGGTWAKEQVYPGLRANNLQGFFEFTDFPMLDADVGVSPRGIIPGEAMYSYLHKYAEHFDILRRILFKTVVLRATSNDDATKAWTVELASAGKKTTEAQRTITCSKLLVATGLTSRPIYPSYPGTSNFCKPLVHTVDIASAGTALLNDPSITYITVIGGGKSGHDAVYRLACAGKRVTWVIRQSGRGTMWMSGSWPQLGPITVWLEGLLMTRPLSWFGAAPWSTGDGFGAVRYLLHNTAAGRWVVRNYFANMSQSTLDQSGILKSEKTKPLVPKETMMWYGGQAGILHYESNIYEVLHRDNVEVISSNISRFDGDAVVLENGKHIQTDAVICATGYEFGPGFSLLPATKQPAWGVPVPIPAKEPPPGTQNSTHNNINEALRKNPELEIQETPAAESDLFAPLEARADAELFARFPELKNGPSYPDRDPQLTPWRLWRFIAPPAQVVAGPRTLAFLANVETYQNVLKAELIALWSYAYLNDELTVRPGSESEVMYEATLWSRFGKWRCPMGGQGKTADTLHDNLPYYDLLLRDLGLRSWRKGWGVLGEVFGGYYEVKDYRGIVEEFVAGRGRGRRRRRMGWGR